MDLLLLALRLQLPHSLLQVPRRSLQHRRLGLPSRGANAAQLCSSTILRSPRAGPPSASDSSLVARGGASAVMEVRLAWPAGGHIWKWVGTGQGGGGDRDKGWQGVLSVRLPPFAAPGTSVAATACRPFRRAGGLAMLPPNDRCPALACRPPCHVSRPCGMHALWRAMVMKVHPAELYTRASAGQTHDHRRTRYGIGQPHPETCGCNPACAGPAQAKKDATHTSAAALRPSRAGHRRAFIYNIKIYTCCGACCGTSQMLQ